jgi:hypothetical protein
MSKLDFIHISFWQQATKSFFDRLKPLFSPELLTIEKIVRLRLEVLLNKVGYFA